MKLEKAIEDLTLLKNPLWGEHSKNWMDAVQLGIEALKHEQQRRKYLVNSSGELLPGETKD